jgi:hypothetical protein
MNSSNKRTLIPLLLLALGALASAQEPEISTKEATSVNSLESLISFGVPVLGLKETNISAVREALVALTIETFECENCKTVELAAGTCVACPRPLVPTRHKQIRTVEGSVNVSGGKIILVVDPLVPTRLSRIRAILEGHSVRIRTADMHLPSISQLVVSGAGADQLPMIEKALTRKGFFKSASAAYVEPSEEFLVLVKTPATLPPTHGDVSRALEGMKLRLADVIVGRTTVLR